ncbi:MAG TPA: DNA repair protein RecN [Lentisphaeria bacterium]|nr:DNA repair protein RecN [Lentisphaeria bacterium]HCG50948.1 DNA repair protein RecN [Lentisphaeria bacterium]
MLKWMRLKNLALVDKADMEFGPGFNVITGETGAGKSVIMGGVGLLLGGRADKSAIRIGTDRCEVSGEFFVGDGSASRVKAILDEAGIESDPAGNLLVRRVITASSSRNFVNESPVTLQILHRIGEVLVDIHGASENHQLLKNQNQLDMLDRFGRLDAELAEVRAVWSELAKLRQEKKSFAESMPSAEETARFRRDAAEIEKAAPVSGEDEELEARHTVAAHSKSIIEVALTAANALSECEDSLADRVGQVRRMLGDLEKFDPDHAEQFIRAIEEISAQVMSLSNDLTDHASEVDIDEGEFMAMEERLRVLQTMKRRYGPTLDDVLAHLAFLQSKIEAYDNSEVIRENFGKREKELLSRLTAACARLSAARKKAGKALAKQIGSELKKLGFKRSDFEVVVMDAAPGADGADRIEFMFTANPGVPLMPLREVASSGELSRVMLAAKTVLAEADSIPILIFDEIDANIGGETASRVGQEIAALAENKQILCISHLPQVACNASVHFMVSKESAADVTTTHIRRLDKASRINEISRMLGGGEIAHEHAEAMLK